MFGGPSRPPGAGRPEGIIFSPNAEPLSGGPLGHPKCRDAIGAWFERVDGNHDGIIDRGEFLLDTQAQFERMDIHHAGYVTPADLSEYRAPYEPAGGGDSDIGEPPPSERPSGGANEHHRAGGGGRAPTRSPGVDTRADPVMSADKNLNFKVTEADFLIHANEVFVSLNSGHDERLTRDQVFTLCKDGEDPAHR